MEYLRNVLSALIKNFDTVESVIETSANSAGSALKENERYLDSIQGKIDQFNNAMQAMWSNTLDSDVVKFFVELGTQVIKLIDKIGLLPSALAGVFVYFTAFKKQNPFDWLKDAGQYLSAFRGKDGIKQLVGQLLGIAPAMKVVTAETIANTVATQMNDAAKAKQIMSEMGLATATGTLSVAQKEQASTAILNAMSTGQLTMAQGNAMLAMLGYSGATMAADGSLKILDATTKSFMASNPIGWILLAVSAVAMLSMALSKIPSKTERLEEKLSNLNSEIDTLNGEIDTLNSELKTTQDRMAELLSMDSLSFVEQEELKNLQLQNEELERQVKLQEILLKEKEKERAKTAKKQIDNIWNGKNVDKQYAVFGNGTIGEDSFLTSGVSGKDALNKSLPIYTELREETDKMEEAYLLAKQELEETGELTLDTFKKVYSLNPNNKGDADKVYNLPGSLYGDDAHFIDALGDVIETNNGTLGNMRDGVELVLRDMSKIISENELSYSIGDDEVNKFLDEYYAYTLAYQQAQGVYVKSNAISSMFDATSTKEMQALGKYLRDIADSDIADEDKNKKILEQLDSIDGVLGDDVNKIEGKTDAYNRLHLAMETIGVTSQDISDYFVLETGAFDSNTVEGITNQFKAAKAALEQLKSGAININDLVKYDVTSGDVTGDVVAIAEKLKGVSPEVREQFISIVEDIKEGAYDTEEGLINWDSAIKKLELHGMRAVIANIQTELEATNKLAFPDLEVSGWLDSVDELSGAFESLASAMDLIVTAQDQMSSSGRISMKTALELMAATDDWNQILEVNNGVITMNANAEQILIQSKLDLIKANIEMALQQVETDIATMESAINSTEAGNALVNGLGKAIKHVQGGLVGLKAGWDALWSGGDVFEAIKSGYSQTIDNLTPDQTSLGELYKQRDELNKKLSMIGSVDTTQEFKNNYDFSTNPGDKYGEDEESKAKKALDAFKAAMDYWENRIGANQAKYDQLQNEIDLLETKGQKVNKDYYEEQLKLLTGEDGKLELLKSQLAEVKKYTGYIDENGNKITGIFKEGSEEWWEAANIANELESELDNVTATIVDLQDAIGEIDTYKFEEFNKRLGDITSKLGTIRDLIAPDGEEDWFNEQGEWTEDGVTVLGSYIQELETYKNGLAKTQDELKKYDRPYDGNEDYYKSLGIHSEQEYYDKTEELINQQYDYAKSISDTEQSVVDMYVSNIDAVEEYTETLIDSYNDYIDSVKEALDAERDLYDFKKNVQKQSNDIAAIERRIASLSGSTNASDIAERRKLEAELYESRESLNDTYYDHARSAQDEALDAEQTAYEETMTKFIDGLRISLETATMNMDEFLMGVTSMVMYNADTVLTKYQETNLPLTDELTNPWIKAKEAVGTYSGDALALMNEWTEEGGFFAQFNATGTKNLQSPWSAGANAAVDFGSDVSDVMDGVVTDISTNVETASGKLSALYKQILDTKNRVADLGGDDGGGSGGGTGTGNIIDTDTTDKGKLETYDPPEKTKQPTEAQKIAAKIVRFGSAQGRGMNAGKKGDNGVITWNGKEYKVQNSGKVYYKGANLYTAAVDHLKFGDRQIFGYNGKIYGYLDGAIQEIEGRFWSPKGYKDFVAGVKANYSAYSQGTTGTTRDEWAITDEPQFGDELVLVPGKDGNLSFMRKGTGVVPADLTQKLFELAQIPTSDLMNKNLTAVVPNITKNDFKNEFNFESLVHVDTVDSDTLPKLEKMVDKKIDDFSKSLNYSIKRFAR